MSRQPRKSVSIPLKSKAKSTSKVSIYDVAKLAQVSIATVSETLNQKGRISQETRARIQQACAQLGYKPNPAARSLSRLRAFGPDRPRTHLFGFTPVITERDSTYSLFLDGAARASQEKQRAILYQPLRWSSPQSAAPLRQFAVDGRLLVGVVNDEILRAIEGDNVPLVVLGDHEASCPSWNVNVDCYDAGERAVKYLWELGHRRFVLFCEASQLNLRFQKNFERGFRDALDAKAVLPQDFSVIKKDDGKEELAVQLSRSDRPTAVIGIMSRKAGYAFTVAKTLNLDIPRDLSLLMFGRPEHVISPVTYFDPAYEEVGRRAMEILIELSSSHEPQIPSRTLVTAPLIETDTCARPPT